MLEDRTIAALRRGLDMATFRHDLLSHNIANADTPGYQRLDISFADFLDDTKTNLPLVRTNIAHISDSESTGAIQVARTPGAARADGNTVVIESEMASLSQNAMYYQAISTQLGKYFGRMRLAISGRG
ncbi:MAG TPA: flagellar basal body rod protein FlgB [Bacillota bacterium]|nr:flagellar basal body rod protein FlgB [Bacillota bacterium]